MTHKTAWKPKCCWCCFSQQLLFNINKLTFNGYWFILSACNVIITKPACDDCTSLTSPWIFFSDLAFNSKHLCATGGLVCTQATSSSHKPNISLNTVCCSTHLYRASIAGPHTHKPTGCCKGFLPLCDSDNSEAAEMGLMRGQRVQIRNSCFMVPAATCSSLIAVWVGWPLTFAGSSDQNTGSFRSGWIGTSKGCVCHSNTPRS